MKTDYRVIDKIHLNLEFRDKPSKDLGDIFHAAVRACCREYPINPDRRPEETVEYCNECDGMVWTRPQGYMAPKILKVLAKQLGIRIRIISFVENCKGKTFRAVPS